MSTPAPQSPNIDLLLLATSWSHRWALPQHSGESKCQDCHQLLLEKSNWKEPMYALFFLEDASLCSGAALPSIAHLRAPLTCLALF